MGNSNSSESSLSAKHQLRCVDDHEKILVYGYVRLNIDVKIPTELINICILFYGQGCQSNILTSKEWAYLMNILYEQKLNDLDNNSNKFIKLELLYESIASSGSCPIFHDKCDDKGATVLIVRSQFNHIFGGYSSISWHSKDGWKPMKDQYAFLLLLRSQFDEHTYALPKVCKLLKPDHNCAVYHYGEENGPAFGGYHSLIIDSCSNTYTSGGGAEYDFIGNELCGGHTFQSTSSSYQFKAEEWEVFQVNNIPFVLQN